MVHAEPRCAACGLSFERDDYWPGAYVINVIVTETVFGVCLLALVVATWPDTPWTLWLARDLAFRPPADADFETPTR